jgi:hypothetical protein
VPVLVAIGLVLIVFTLVLGLWLLRVRDVELPEQLGVGVVSSAPASAGRGFAVSAGVRIRSCDEPVVVTLVVTGTAEYWIDRAKQLRRSGTLRLAVPDDREASDIQGDIEIGLGSDGKLSPIAPVTEAPQPDRRLQPLPDERLRWVAVTGARIRGWGRHIRPVVFRFDASWLERRDRLGTCYLRVPALAGAPTALSAQEIRQKAVDIHEEPPPPRSILEVASDKRRAYYLPELETTRGVTAAELGANTLRTDLSQPPPDGNVRGVPSWTCATRPVRSFRILETVDPGERPGLVEGASPDATGAVSVRHLGTAVTERNCATFAVVEESGAQFRRDLVLLGLGALFSLGMTLIAEPFLRRRADAAGGAGRGGPRRRSRPPGPIG